MNTATHTIPSTVTSPDGTEIAYHTSGDGPPLLLVHGGGGDHTRWGALVAHLEPHVTVHAMDRRGHGASGDHPDYRLEREFEDVAAVIDAIAAASGSPVAVYGHSYGGICAFGATALASNISRLALYEGWPPVDHGHFPPPAGHLQHVEALLEAGDAEAALQTVLRQVVGLTEEELRRYREQPSWAARLRAVHHFRREERTFFDVRFDPQQASGITVPTMLLTGGQSPDWGLEVADVAAALPDARVSVLEGQGHGADIMVPEVVAERLLAFVADSP